MHKVTYVSIAILFVLLLLGFLFLSGNSKANVVQSERFYVDDSSALPQVVSVGDNANKTARPDAAASGLGNLKPSDPLGNEMYNPVSDSRSPAPANTSCFPRDRLTADDLLPKDAANSRWAQMNPAGQGDVKDQNFLTSGYHVGVNTVGSSLRNANLQLRSEPPNPQMAVSPWNISTIEPSDTLRRPLEIGGDF